jgi:PDZ domain-containing secreted protein
VVVPIGNGLTGYMAADQIAKIVAVRDSAQSAADKLYKKASKESLTNSQVATVNRKLDHAFQAEISLRSNVVDRNGKTIGKFMDRTTALRWIDQNAWWL